MEYDYELVVLGNPKAQKRARARSFGRFAKIHDNPDNFDNKATLWQVIQDKAPDKPLSGPLCVDIDFYFPHIKGHYGTGRNEGKLKASAPIWHTVKPDRDNLDKLVLDTLSKKFWRDDCQVCDGRITKRYSEKPRTEIKIRIMET